jgi:tetratricopeptide (TPR) repeat protein
MPDWLDYLEVEYANFHAALEWAQERNIEAGLRLCNALFRLWENRGDYRKEGLEWFEKFLAVSTASRTTLRAWALYRTAMLFIANDMEPKYKPLLEESLSLAREISEHACVARILIEIGNDESYDENFDKARVLFEESLSEARLANDEIAVGNAIYGLGGLAEMQQSDHKTARSLTEESLTIFRKMGELTGWQWSLTAIGILCSRQGDWSAAREYFEQTLLLSQEARNRLHTSLCLNNLGDVALSMGEFDNALSLFEQCRKLVQDTPDDSNLYLTFFNIGEVTRLQGKYDEAITYFKKSLAKANRDTRRAFVY